MPVTSLLCYLNGYARQVVVIHQGSVPFALITGCPLHYSAIQPCVIHKPGQVHWSSFIVGRLVNLQNSTQGIYV